MNPVAKVRSGATRAWRGTARTAKWAAGGVASGPKRAAGAIAGTARDARARVRDGSQATLDRSGATRALERARSNPRIAIAWAAGILLVIAWIGWAIYVTTEHGGSAGLGVLISWPAAIAALALVAAPFVGVYLLVQRLRLREPALAGAAGAADAPERAERPEDRAPEDDSDSDDDATEESDDEPEAREEPARQSGD